MIMFIIIESEFEYDVNCVCSGGDKLEFVPASSQLLFSPTSVEVVVDAG